MIRRDLNPQIQKLGDVIPDPQPAVWRAWLDGSSDADAGDWTSEHEQYYHALLGDSRKRILEPDEQVALRQLGDYRKKMGMLNTRLPQNYRGQESFIVNRLPDDWCDPREQFRREQWKQFSDMPSHWRPSPHMSDGDKRLIRTAYYYLKQHYGGGLTKAEGVQFSDLVCCQLPLQFGMRDFVRAPVESTLDWLSELKPTRALIRGGLGVAGRVLGGQRGKEEFQTSLYDSMPHLGPELLWKYGIKGVKGGYKLAKFLGKLPFLWAYYGMTDFDNDAHEQAGLRDGEDKIPGYPQMSEDANVYGRLSRRAAQFEGDDFGRGPWQPDYEWNPQDDADYNDEPPAGPDPSRWKLDPNKARFMEQGKERFPRQNSDYLAEQPSLTQDLELLRDALAAGKKPRGGRETVANMAIRGDREGLRSLTRVSDDNLQNRMDRRAARGEGGGGEEVPDESWSRQYRDHMLQLLNEIDQHWQSQGNESIYGPQQMSVDADAPNAYAQHVRRATQFAINPETMQLPKQRRPVRMGSVPTQYKERVAGAPGDYGPKTRVAYKKSGKRLGRKTGYGQGDLVINRRSGLKPPRSRRSGWKPPRSGGSVGFAVNDDDAAAMVAESHPFLKLLSKYPDLKPRQVPFDGPDDAFHDFMLRVVADSNHPAAPEARQHISDEIDRRNLYKFNPAVQSQFSADDYAADLARRHPEYYGEPGHNAHFTPVLPQSMLGQRG